MMRDIIDMINEADGGKYEFLNELETAPLYESEGWAESVPGLGDAIDSLDQAESSVMSVALSYVYSAAASLSSQYRDSFVRVTSQDGNMRVRLYPGPNYAEQLDQMADDPDQEDEALKFQEFVRGLNASGPNRWPPFIMADKLRSEYSIMCVVGLGAGKAFHNGREASLAECNTYENSLSKFCLNLASGS